MLYVYSIKWWYDNQLTTSSGIICAKDAAEATRRLDKEIFEDTEEIHLYSIENGYEDYVTFNDINSFLKEHPLEDED